MPELRLPNFSAALNLPRISVQWLQQVSLLALACYLGGWAGLALPSFGPGGSLLWPPTGIALAALFRLGGRVWPGVWIGAYVLALSSGSPPLSAGWVACASTLGPLAAAAWLRRRGLRFGLDQRRDLWMFATIGVGLLALTTAGTSVLWRTMGGTLALSQAGAAWFFGGLGDALGVLAVGLPLLSVSASSLDRAARRSQWVPALGLSLGAVGSAWLAFGGAGDAHPALLPLTFLPHVLLGRLAVRNGLFAGSVAALLACGGAALASINGVGPIASLDPNRSVELLWGYLFTLVAVAPLMASLAGRLMVDGKRWKLALDASHTGVAELDMVSGRLRMSPGWLAALGFPAQEFGHARSQDLIQNTPDLEHPVHPRARRGPTRLSGPGYRALDCHRTQHPEQVRE